MYIIHTFMLYLQCIMYFGGYDSGKWSCTMYFQLVTSLLSSIASMTASSLAKLISWSLRASTRYIVRRVSRSTDSTDRLFCSLNGAVESLIFHSSKCGPKEHDSAKTQQLKLLFIFSLRGQNVYCSRQLFSNMSLPK